MKTGSPHPWWRRVLRRRWVQALTLCGATFLAISLHRPVYTEYAVTFAGPLELRPQRLTVEADYRPERCIWGITCWPRMMQSPDYFYSSNTFTVPVAADGTARFEVQRNRTFSIGAKRRSYVVAYDPARVTSDDAPFAKSIGDSPPFFVVPPGPFGHRKLVKYRIHILDASLTTPTTWGTGITKLTSIALRLGGYNTDRCEVLVDYSPLVFTRLEQMRNRRIIGLNACSASGNDLVLRPGQSRTFRYQVIDYPAFLKPMPPPRPRGPTEVFLGRVEPQYMRTRVEHRNEWPAVKRLSFEPKGVRLDHDASAQTVTLSIDEPQEEDFILVVGTPSQDDSQFGIDCLQITSEHKGAATFE